MIFPLSATSQSIDIEILDDTGLPVTGLVAATFPTLTYSLAGANADVAFPALSDLATITTAYASGGVKERGNGVYRVDLPNGVFATAGQVRIRGEATGKHVVCPWLDVGNVPANVTQLLGTAWLAPAVAGTPDVNVKFYAGQAVAVGADNLPKVGLWGIMGSLLTQVTGNLAASFSKFLDVLTPIFTAASTNQTGDSYARIGANGAGLTSLAPAATALSNVQWTNSRAGYLDNLNIGGPAASHADVANINLSATKHMTLQTNGQFEPGETYEIEMRTYDATTSSLVNADTTPTLTATGRLSGSLSANLSAATNASTGVYRWTYTPGATPTIEQIRFDGSATISAATFTLSYYSQTVDEATAVLTATDIGHITSIFNKLPANNIADEALLLAAIGSPMQSNDANVAAIKVQTDKLTFSGSNLFTIVEAYAANQDPWSIIKSATPSATPTLGTVEAKLQMIGADEYTDETTDLTQWHVVYVVAGSGSPGVGYTLATKKLWDTGGAKVTANNQVIGQVSQ